MDKNLFNDLFDLDNNGEYTYETSEHARLRERQSKKNIFYNIW